MGVEGDAGKLRSHWKPIVYQVVEKKKDLPVYVIREVTGKKATRTVHRNLLLRCNELPKDMFDGESTDVKQQGKARNRKKEKVKFNTENIAESVEFEDDEDDLQFQAAVSEEQNSVVEDPGMDDQAIRRAGPFQGFQRGGRPGASGVSNDTENADPVEVEDDASVYVDDDETIQLDGSGDFFLKNRVHS